MTSSSAASGFTYALRANKLKSLTTCDTTLATSPQPVVVLICGSFNPIHNAHFKLYSAAKAALEADKNYTVLGGFFSPVSDAYGKPGLRSAAQRVRIVEDAVRHHADLSVDTWECLQPTYTRTLHVLQHLEQHVNAWYTHQEPKEVQRLLEHGRRVRVVFVCGEDLFASFWKPGCWALDLLKKLLDTFRIVVVYRAYQGEGSCAGGFEKARCTSPTITETAADGTVIALNIAAYEFIFARFESPDDTSSTTVREIVAALAKTTPSDAAALKKLRTELSAKVPASAITSIMECYGGG